MQFSESKRVTWCRGKITAVHSVLVALLLPVAPNSHTAASEGDGFTNDKRKEGLILIGDIVLFALLSWLPCLLLLGMLWALLREHSPESFVSLVIVAAVSGGIGFVAGVLLLGPLADSPVLIVLATVVTVGLYCALATRSTPVRAAFAAVFMIAGSHLAVPVRNAGGFSSLDGQGAFWAMPVLDLWLILGVPLLCALLFILVLHKRRAKPVATAQLSEL